MKLNKTTKTNDFLGETFDPEKPMFPINIVAEILNLHQRTLRIYDEENILVPSRTSKNRRLYTYNDIERGKLIQFMTRELGVNLAGIKLVIYLLKKLKISPSQYMEYVNKAGCKLNIIKEE